ncbi:YqhR family membrane protein [Niallia alba]|uniref:YqhR family membrane protein n=1 Tax=Niallia alba TaxID=2729105 RepID=UPI002E2502F6|nr:YqhR family membrane protein [Niallia alba]
MENKQQSHDEKDRPMSFIALVIWTGMFGGIFWSLIGYVGYVFNFTEIRPNIILEPWAIGSWKYGWLGTVISIIAIGFFSTGAAFAYYLMLRKFKTVFIGMGFGIALFACVFIVLNPIFPSMAPFLELKRDTIITSVCLYILYGVFVGYTISYEENEIQIKKWKETKPATTLTGNEGE